MRCILVLVALMLAGQAPAETRFAERLDPSRDELVRRAVVPSPEQPHGEVQVVRRDGLVVVQTVLASPVLRRVAAAIASKEARRWPQGSDGYAGSQRYQAELHQAAGAAWQLFRERPDRDEKRQFLTIEFILGPRQALIALSLPRISGEPGTLQVSAKNVLAVWSGPRAYVRANSAAIVADSFGLDEQQAAAWLGGLRQNSTSGE